MSFSLFLPKSPLIETIRVYFKILREGAILPKKASEGAGCYDIAVCLEEKILLRPLERKLLPTGLAVEIPPGYILSIKPRSSFSYKEGITLINSPGVIDSDYRGEIFLPVINLSSKEVWIYPGDRIAQCMLERSYEISWEYKEELSFTPRGEGGFGSTGRRG